jgi:hypothetical protein
VQPGRANRLHHGDTLGGKELPEGMCVADLLALVIVKQAIRGKFAFVREVLERMDGKVPDRSAGHDGGPIGLESDGLAGLDDADLVDLERIAGKLCEAPEGDDRSRGKPRGPHDERSDPRGVGVERPTRRLMFRPQTHR